MRALRLTGRFFLVAWVFFAALVVYGARRLFTRRGDVERLRGEMLASTFQRLGATYVKFGQILSTRPDLVGPGITEPLSRLQDQVAPVPFAQIARVLDEELDATTRARLVEIEETPIAAASVAQVHRAKLADGTQVALKVQRPSARAQVERDLVLLMLGAKLVSLLPSVRLLSLPGAVERFGDAMKGQLDFRLEAANNRRFAENFASDEGIHVPRLFDELCTERVLGMEFVDGVRATEPEKVGGDRVALAARGLRCILQMVFKDGFVHADLHPGNIMLTPDGRVVLIDLGLVAEIDDELKGPWIQTFVAVSQQDGKMAAGLFYSYAPTVSKHIDYAAFEADVLAHFQSFHGKPLHELEASVVLGGMMNILRKHRVQVDPVFTVVNLAMLVAEGLGKQLDPKLDLIAHAAPFLMEAIAVAPPPRPPRREVPTA
ncbi:MAG: AarF/ABC1/UbiB kinase family protein [Myxococcales bacterium]|nr:AarF/ABC1/UbiB kinase family protein [Myxococcales bacterium]